jgi:diaminopimelate epimerase
MIQFTKLQGNGNDFILIDEYNNEIISANQKPAFAVKYCDRRYGIGADGVLYLGRSKEANIKMRIFNSDGTEAEMCGNGVRCLVKYALDEGYITGTATVETNAGLLQITSRKDDRTRITVNMGKPDFSREKIPAYGSGDFIIQNLHGFEISAVNTGVPHAIVLVDSLDFDIRGIAQKIRHDPAFPMGINVNFVRVNSEKEITIRTYERGVEDETYSCGTGSVASAAITHRLGKTGNKVKVNTKGGELNITLTDKTAFMEGSADRVFEGIIKLDI